MKVLIIGATHGNELLGVKLYQRMLSKRLPMLEHIDFLIGNPRAFAAKKRYTDADLNRCYDGASQGYESLRAKEVCAYIEMTTPDLLLDMHTTNCIQPPCLIVDDISRYINHEAPHRDKELYEMYDKIYKRDVTVKEAHSFENFVPNALGFVPVMTGENSYKRQTDYLGFKTKRPRRIKV